MKSSFMIKRVVIFNTYLQISKWVTQCAWICRISNSKIRFGNLGYARYNRVSQLILNNIVSQFRTWNPQKLFWCSYSLQTNENRYIMLSKQDTKTSAILVLYFGSVYLYSAYFHKKWLVFRWKQKVITWERYTFQWIYVEGGRAE